MKFFGAIILFNVLLNVHNSEQFTLWDGNDYEEVLIGLSNLFKESCRKDIGLQTKLTELSECMGGDLDIATDKTHFGKQCERKSSIKDCQEQALEKLKPCLIESNHDLINATANAFDEYIDYYCNKSYNEVKDYRLTKTCLYTLRAGFSECYWEGMSNFYAESKENKCRCGKIDKFSKCFKNEVTNADIVRIHEQFVNISRRSYDMSSFKCSLASRMSMLSTVIVLLMAFGIYLMNNSKN